MAVLNKRAIVTAIEMYGVTAIKLPSTLGLNYSAIVQALFANGEQGFFYDPNDLSTMFQDAAGTVPVTAAGQPVGLILDKSKGLRVVPVPTSWDGTFANGFTAMAASNHWTLVNGKAYHAFTTEPLALTLLIPSQKLGAFIEFDAEVLTAKDTAQLQINGDTTKVFNFGSGRHKVYLPSGTTSFQFKRNPSMAGAEFYIDNVTLHEIQGNHAYQTTSASRPILRQNATTGAYYLEFDGSDDFLQTSSIDFTGTDKVSLFAGVRKLSDATRGILLHTGAGTPTPGVRGSFSIEAPNYEFKGYAATIPGAAGNFDAKNDTASAPHSAVLSIKLWQSAPNKDAAIQLNVNNTLAPVVGSTGMLPGNFGNLPAFIGRRAGTSLTFNGHIYSLIGIGRLTSDSETVAIEKELAKRLGVTLNV